MNVVPFGSLRSSSPDVDASQERLPRDLVPIYGSLCDHIEVGCCGGKVEHCTLFSRLDCLRYLYLRVLFLPLLDGLYQYCFLSYVLRGDLMYVVFHHFISMILHRSPLSSEL